MNSYNSKKSDPHRLSPNVTDKINQILAYTIHGKI